MVFRTWTLLHRSGWKATLERCDCVGYWFPHRRGGGACEHSPYRDYHVALRAGATLAEAQQLLTADQLDRLFPLGE